MILRVGQLWEFNVDGEKIVCRITEVGDRVKDITIRGLKEGVFMVGETTNVPYDRYQYDINNLNGRLLGDFNEYYKQTV